MVLWRPRCILDTITLTSVLYLHLEKIASPPLEQLRALTFCSGDPQQRQLRTVKLLFHQVVPVYNQDVPVNLQLAGLVGSWANHSNDKYCGHGVHN